MQIEKLHSSGILVGNAEKNQTEPHSGDIFKSAAAKRYRSYAAFDLTKRFGYQDPTANAAGYPGFSAAESEACAPNKPRCQLIGLTALSGLTGSCAWVWV